MVGEFKTIKLDYFNNNIIYDLSNTENHIFITTEVGLYIYDNNNNKTPNYPKLIQ